MPLAGLIFIVGLAILLYHERAAHYYTLYFALVALLASFIYPEHLGLCISAYAIFGLWLVFFQWSGLRLRLMTPFLLGFYQKTRPKLSLTEAEALAAGTVDWDRELFSGKPNWPALWAKKLNVLSEQERAFLKGPVERLCEQALQHNFLAIEQDIPEAIWRSLQKEGFLGLQIAKEYGGLGFSKTAIAVILAKIASVSQVLASMVSVPNSLGPAELLVDYGTEKQKAHYLPRLAQGLEIPCFALTSPEAGSDASAMPDYGIIAQGEWQGSHTLGIRLTWNKRYITLAPKATLLGLAFKLYDPDKLLGEKTELGITCALIPTTHPGVIIGRRHYIANAFFINGPTSGEEVFIPLDWIIGGVERVGQGWRMLTESLSAGRAMALPGVSLGGAYAILLSSAAYALARQQFKMPIGFFEGIQEKIAAMALSVYQTQTMMQMTLSAVDQGQKPSVPSAIVKYYATESARSILHAAMDIQGGKAICMGPNNDLSDAFALAPIGITVEGANILTRNMIIFGQGAIRCHPYVSAEMQAATDPDLKRGLINFDKAVWAHMAHFLSLWPRILWQSLTGAWLIWPQRNKHWRCLQKLTRASARFAGLAEMCFLVYGAGLKFEERVSARMADILIQLYAASATLQYAEQGFDKALLGQTLACHLNEAALQENLFLIDQASVEILDNLKSRALGRFLKGICLPWGRQFSRLADEGKRKIAKAWVLGQARHSAMNDLIYAPESGTHSLSQLLGLQKNIAKAQPLYQRIKVAVRQKKCQAHPFSESLLDAQNKGILTALEYQLLNEIEHSIAKIIQVDDFAGDAFIRSKGA